MRKQLKELDAKLEGFKDDLHKGLNIPPGYFYKPIFQVVMTLILIVTAIDVGMNNWQLRSYTLDCPVDAQDGFCVFNAQNLDKIPQEMRADILKKGELVRSDDPFCTDPVFCTNVKVYAGYHYGRTDGLAKYGWILIIELVVVAFLLNHVRWLRARHH